LPSSAAMSREQVENVRKTHFEINFSKQNEKKKL
jgi:hypothetical protein